MSACSSGTRDQCIGASAGLLRHCKHGGERASASYRRTGGQSSNLFDRNGTEQCQIISRAETNASKAHPPPGSSATDPACKQEGTERNMTYSRPRLSSQALGAVRSSRAAPAPWPLSVGTEQNGRHRLRERVSKQEQSHSPRLTP